MAARRVPALEALLATVVVAAPALAGQPPLSQVPSSQGQTSQGPSSQGPSSQGPSSQGPSSQGPSSQGPSSQGPSSQGPSSQGPSSQGPSSGGAASIGVDQIAPSRAAGADSVGIRQLPPGLPPLSAGKEDQLAGPSAPPRTLTSQVLTAWSAIRSRGQTPTPDLIAHEIGPDKLAEFLATSPAAANILATGVEPEPPKAEDADKTNGAAVRNILPPGTS